MQNTPNYGLRKPEYNEFADIQDLNYNADIIDTRMKTNETLSNTKVSKSGDTMTGNLKFKSFVPRVEFESSSGNFPAFIQNNVSDVSDFGFDIYRNGTRVFTINPTGQTFVLDNSGVEFSLADLKQSVSDGKNGIKTAILAKGGTVTDPSNPPSFSSLINGVNNMPSGGSSSGIGNSLNLSAGQSATLNVRGLGFTPRVITSTCGQVSVVRRPDFIFAASNAILKLEVNQVLTNGFDVTVTNLSVNILNAQISWEAFQ